MNAQKRFVCLGCGGFLVEFDSNARKNSIISVYRIFIIIILLNDIFITILYLDNFSYHVLVARYGLGTSSIMFWPQLKMVPDNNFGP